MADSLRVHQYPLRDGIRPTPEFAKKKLAQFAANVGVKCGHGCTYCSSGALLRCHTGFKQAGESPFKHGYCIIDPEIPQKVALDAARRRNRGMVQLCTTVDAWCPGAQQFNVGRRCLEAILDQLGWTVRILTKNAAVMRDFDLIQEHRDRVLVGLSLTGPVGREGLRSVIEPLASPVSERMAAMRQAHELGLRTYGMLCPLMPGIADSPDEIDELVMFVKDCGAEEIFAEAVNPRGGGLRDTAESLREAGFTAEADAVSLIRKRSHWSAYVTRLIQTLQSSLRRHGAIDKLRFLLYPSHLLPMDRAAIESDDTGIVWL
jgi:DNA repair photolyase